MHCGATEAVIPHHRQNRGMGGSKARDVPSNIVVMCWHWNDLMESDATVAERARHMGWKLRNTDDPLTAPVWNANVGAWFVLDNEYGKREVRNANR